MTRAEFHQHLDRLRDDTLALGDLAVAAVERAVGALQEDDRAVAAAIVAGDRELDERHTAIQELAITLLATQQPTAGDLRAIAAALATAGELERIGDYAEGAARLILRAPDEPPFPPSHTVYRMAREAVAMLRRSLDAYARRDAGLARRVWAADTTVDTFQRTLYEELLRAMMENPSTLTRATYLLWIVHNLERVADRATNICEQAVFMAEGRWPAADRRERDGAGARPASNASPTPEP